MVLKLNRSEVTMLKVKLNSCKCCRKFRINQIALKPIWFHVKFNVNMLWIKHFKSTFTRNRISCIVSWNLISISGTNQIKINFTNISVNIFYPNFTHISYNHYVCWNLHNISWGKIGNTGHKLNTEEPKIGRKTKYLAY